MKFVTLMMCVHIVLKRPKCLSHALLLKYVGQMDFSLSLLSFRKFFPL